MHSKKGLMKVAAITGLALVMTTGIAMASIGTGTVTADALRLRSQANTNSNILTLAPHNSVVTLLEELDGWPIYSLFVPSDIPNYETYAPEECAMCKSGKKIDALVNSYGLSIL